MSQREPFKRNLLKGLTEKRYIKKLEHVIVDEGKRLLNSLKIKYIIVSQKQITKFLEKHSSFKEAFNKHTIWHQIRIQYLYDTHQINSKQYRLLSTMRQVLNKNNDYILRKNEFDNRKFVIQCEWYPKTKKCLRDQCVATHVCPHHYKNFETNHKKLKRYTEEYYKKKGKTFVKKETKNVK